GGPLPRTVGRRRCGSTRLSVGDRFGGARRSVPPLRGGPLRGVVRGQARLRARAHRLPRYRAQRQGSRAGGGGDRARVAARGKHADALDPRAPKGDRQMFENFDWIGAIRTSPVMIVILGLSVFTFGLAIERAFY